MLNYKMKQTMFFYKENQFRSYTSLFKSIQKEKTTTENNLDETAIIY